MRQVYGHIRYIVKCAVWERPTAAFFYVIRETINLIRNLVNAKIVGWPDSFLGAGSKVIGSKAISVGKGASIKRHAWIESIFAYYDQSFSPSIIIGDFFSASDRLHISSINQIEIGDNCLFGSGVYISDHNHGGYRGNIQSFPEEPPIKRKLISSGPVIIGSNVWLGDNVIIIGPVTIGDGAVIGANSVVTKDVPGGAIAAGIPARVLKKFNRQNCQWEKSQH